jgi:ribosomal protein L7/L12
MTDNNPETQALLVKEAIFRGRKIEAIKRYREQTGCGLKESKEAVERLEAELRVSSPESFASAPERTVISPGAVVIAALILAAVSLLVFLAIFF